MKAKFDDATIRNLRPKVKAFDCMAEKELGFGIRVHPTGTMTFFYQYKVDGRRSFMSLGNYPDTTLKEARGLYQAALVKVKDLRRGSKDGFDPVQEIKRQKRERLEDGQRDRDALTVKKLVDDYIELYAKKFKRSWEKDQQILYREILMNPKEQKSKKVNFAYWGDRKAEDIKRTDIVALLDGIVARNAPIMANNTFAVIRKMFNWAVEKGKLDNTPCLGLKLPSPKVECERVLSESEIKTLWDRLESADLNMSCEIKAALKMVLITGQRPGEVIGLHTNEIDGNWWTLPAERSKNGREHRVYLATTAIEIIHQMITSIKSSRNILPELEYDGFIFPTPQKDKKQPIGGTAMPIAVLRNLNYSLTDDKGQPIYNKEGKLATENRLGVYSFTPHDLRRTTATFISQLGFMDEVIDAVLNHKKKGIIKTYNKNKYDDEKQKALEAWERKLNSIITGNECKVIPIGRKAA